MKKVIGPNSAAIPEYTAVFAGPDFPLAKRGVAAIHEASLEVLADTGFRFASDSALQIFRSHGFRVEGQRVYFTERQIRRALA
ncbi:MAG: trimethylamine methyltransferase family protein, partial [Spirochaetales bacterium]|nr:trimethylamine methyltransferase family protein [Spirochaetales bacterium]